jgi:cytochrome c-type biogenesis protein CcmF
VLLAIIWLVAGVLIWFAWRREPIDDSQGGIGGRRFISYNNWLLVLLTMVVFVGTMFPFFSSLLTEETVSLQEGGYFTKTAAPFGLAILLLMGVCPELVRHGIKSSWRTIGAVLFALAGIAGWVVTKNLAIPCFVFCGFSSINLAADFVTGLGAKSRGKSLRWYGSRMAHVGVVLVFFGIAGSGAYDVEERAALIPGQSVTVGKYRVQFDELRADHSGANFIAVFADVSVYMATDSNEAGSEPLFKLSPARAFYKNDKKTSEVDIHRSLAGDFYVALADVDSSRRLINLRVLIKPLINWIWIGSTISVVGASLVIFSFYRKKTTV